MYVKNEVDLMVVQKRGRGRPLRDGPWMKITTNLRLETVAFLQEIGRGRVNDGIEILADAMRVTLETQARRKEEDEARRAR